MAIKIHVSYQIKDSVTGATLAPNPDVPNASYTTVLDTAEGVKAYILANAQAKVNAVAPAAAAAQAILDAIDDVP